MDFFKGQPFYPFFFKLIKNYPWAKQQKNCSILKDILKKICFCSYKDQTTK